MKAILITILLVILGWIGFSYYSDWKRFNPPNYEYVSQATIDANHPDKTLLLNYHKAVEGLNGFVITQWTTQEIDVRNPEDDDATTLAAVLKYRDLLGTVSYYESQLTAPLTKEEKTNEQTIKNNLIQTMFDTNPQANSFRLGERSPLVFEVQKILNKKGDSIKEDGVYNVETRNALKAFETKNGLFSDGKLDHVTLYHLLK